MSPQLQLQMTLCINPRCPHPQNLDEHLFCQSCGSELLLEGRYRVTRQRGKGGFGTTYEVSDNRRQAFGQGNNDSKILKVLTDNQPKHVELFQREAFLLSQLHHAGIPNVEEGAYFTLHPQNGMEPMHCIVMEKIVGLDLQDYLRKRGQPIDQKLALHWLTQVVEILQVLHHRHVLHRDIKPSNIMLKTDGNLALVDFGTARSVTNISGDPSGQFGTRVVSSFYSPREQMHGQAVAQSDFFALGRTFVYLLTNQELNIFYDAATDSLNWHQAAPDVTPEFRAFLDQLMRPAVNERPANAADILEQLKVLLTHSYSIPTESIENAPTAFANPLTTLSSPQALPSTSPPQPEPPTSALDPRFVQRCQRELVEFIGPIAMIICQQTLAQNPQSSEQAFVEALTRHISNPQDAHHFKQKFQ
ncbi:MAG: serine/threonine protein kinase [Thermosynechococcaceae cyanobacterium]